MMQLQNLIKVTDAGVFQASYIPADLQLLLDLHALIELHFKDRHDPEYYSSSLNMSLKRLNRLTGVFADKTVYQILQERLHLEAEMLLKHTTLTAKQIAFELGVCNPAHFSKCFKRITGMSPVCFRKYHEKLTKEYTEEQGARGNGIGMYRIMGHENIGP